MIHGVKREIQKFRARIAQEDRDFAAAAPPVDEDGLPSWDGSEPLSVAGYMKAMGFAPDEELSGEELETRERLSPYREIFETLQRDANEKEAGT